MTCASYEFRHAITRRPGPSVVDGLRAADTGTPDHALMLRDHAAYVAALRAADVAVTVLPPLDGFPDALFVEDTALCLPQGAVLMRPGAPSRQGEVAAMEPALRTRFGEVQRISAPGHIEGGDILVTEREVLVGLSARTDARGVAQLAEIVEDWGHRLRQVDTPDGVLHFKTDCSLLDAETILATRRLADTGAFAGYRVLILPDSEEAAANAIRVNGRVIMPAGFARTAEMLAAAGYDVVGVGNTECAKLDGGMSCLSLRF